MMKAAATRSGHSQNWSFWAHLGYLWSMVVADAASLCYSFTVGKAESGPWRQKVQGQLNEETFLSYNSNKGHVSGVLGIRLNATKIWETQADTLKDGIDLFKAEVVHMKQENVTVTASSTAAPDVDQQPLSQAIKPSTSILLTILICFLLLFLSGESFAMTG